MPAQPSLNDWYRVRDHILCPRGPWHSSAENVLSEIIEPQQEREEFHIFIFHSVPGLNCSQPRTQLTLFNRIAPDLPKKLTYRGIAELGVRHEQEVY